MEKISKQFLSDRLTAGATIRDLAVATGLSTGQVKTLLNHHGLRANRSGPARKLPSALEIAARLERGQHASEIALEFAVTTTAVYDALRRVGMQVRDHYAFNRPSPIRKLPPLAELVKRIEAGESTKSIAEQAGTTYVAVHVALRRGGLTVGEIRKGRHNERSRRKGRFGFPDYVFGLRPGHGLGGAK